MANLNYSKWDKLDSDESGDEASEASQHLEAAQARKREADKIFEAMLDSSDARAPGHPGGIASGMARARSLYDGALAALGPSSAAESPAARELRLACHLNAAAGAIQEKRWPEALHHAEAAVVLAPGHHKALEFLAHVLWRGMGHPGRAAAAIEAGLAHGAETGAEAAGDPEPSDAAVRRGLEETLANAREAAREAEGRLAAEAADPAVRAAARASEAKAEAQRRALLKASAAASARRRLGTELSGGQEAMARRDWAAAERFLKDAKRTAAAAGDAQVGCRQAGST